MVFSVFESVTGAGFARIEPEAVQSGAGLRCAVENAPLSFKN